MSYFISYCHYGVYQEVCCMTELLILTEEMLSSLSDLLAVACGHYTSECNLPNKGLFDGDYGSKCTWHCMKNKRKVFAYVSILSTPCILPYSSSVPASLGCSSSSISPSTLLLAFPLSPAVPFVMLCHNLFCVLALP